MIKVRASQIFSHELDDVVAAKKLLDASAPFSEVVERYSTCPSKQNGGDLGWMPEGSVQSLLGESISEREKGKILGPVHSQYGYHILMITDVEVEEAPGPFTAGDSMVEINARFPDVHTLLFKQFHIGLPVAGYKPEETLRSVCQAAGKPDAEVVNYINSQYAEKHIEVIAPEELKQKIDAGNSNLALLDIRESWERDIAKIDGSVFITKENCESVLNSLTKDREIVLVDWKQDRSPSFLKWVSSRGYANAKCLEGGIDAWAEKVETRLSRYDIDEDDGYRYEDVVDEHSH